MSTLERLSQTEWDAYLENAIREYADAHVWVGNWQVEGALERSRGEFAKWLPHFAPRIGGASHRARFVHKIGYCERNVRISKNLEPKL